MPNVKINKEFEFCTSCQMGKPLKLLFHNSLSRASKSLEFVHTDLWSPAQFCLNMVLDIIYCFLMTIADMCGSII